MEQVYRIEIPVEALDVSDTAALRNLETTLQRIFTSAAHGKSTLKDALNSINSGASSASSALKSLESAVESTADSFDEAGSAAQDAGNDEKSAASGAESATDKLESAVDQVGDAYDDAGRSAQDAGNKSNSAFNQATSSTDKFTQRVEKSNKTLREMFKEKMNLIMEAIDRASPVLKNIWNSAKSLAGKAWRVTVKMFDLVTAPFRALKNMIMSPIMMTLSIAGIGLGASSFYSTFADFEAGMSNVKALSGATQEEFVSLTEKAKELGATTKFTAAEASEGMQYLAMAGWKTNEIIDAMPGLLQLAAAGQTDLGTAADIVSDVMTAMGMSASDATRAADVFARTATSTNTTISMMGETLKYAAPAAKAFGMELEDVAALTGMMANAGIKGSTAGTALRTSLLRMASPTKEVADAMKKLGVSFDDGHGNMKDMRTIVSDLTTAFGKLGNQEKLAAADDLFGKTASTAWLAVLDQGIDAYDELSNSLYNATGAAQEMADIQLDNLAGDVTLLQSAVDGMKISLMDKISPFLRQGVQWVTAKIPEITERLGNLVDKGIEKAKELKKFLSGVFESTEFKNADGFAEKFFVAWDKIIAQPFQEWWGGDGKAKVLGIMSDLGGQIGELLHGIILGVWAALKGEDVSFEGMNLGGIAQAGAEAAKSFVSSFVSGLNLGEVVSEAPGGLKALALGFGGIKLGSGLFTAAKDIGMLRIALKGVAPAAGAAAASTAEVGSATVAAGAGAGKAATLLGGLKGVLSAIPVWGWVAAAAIAAVVIGVHAYNKHIQQEKEELWALGDAVEVATQEFQQTASKVNQTVSDLDALNRERHQIDFILWVNRVGLTDEQIDNVKTKIDGIDNQMKSVIFNIVQFGNLTAEEAVEVANQLATIKSDKKTVLASIISIGNTEKGKEVYDLIQQYELAGLTGDTEKQAKLRAQIIALCEPTKAQETLDLLNQFDNADLDPLQAAMIIAQILANTGGNADAAAVLELLERYKNAKLAAVTMSNVIATISATMPDGEKAAKVLELLKDYNSANLPALIAAFAAAGIDVSGDTDKGRAMLTLLENYDTADLPLVIATLASAGINVNGDTAEGAAMLALLNEYNDAGLPALLAILTLAGVNVTGDTETGQKMLALLKRYKAAQLTSETIDIEAELDAICPDPALKALYLPLFEKYANLESNEANIIADLDTSGVSEDEIALLKQLADLVAERDNLSLILEAGGLSEEEVAQYKSRYEEILTEITNLTNGAVDAHNLEGAAIDANIAKLEEQLGIQKEIARLKQESALLDLRDRMPEVIEGEKRSRQKEAEIQAEIDAASVQPTEAYNIQREFLELENKRKDMWNGGNTDIGAYQGWYFGEGGYQEQVEGLYKRYQALNNVSENDANTMWQSTSSRLVEDISWGTSGHGGSLNMEFGEGGFVSALDSFLNGNASELAYLNSQLAAQQAETAKYTNDRMQYYSGSEANATAKNFAGTQYEGMSLAEIAGHYSEFANNPMMVSAFERSVEALNGLNKSVVEGGIMGQDEITTADMINAIKDASFANTPTETVTDPTTGETRQLINTDQAYSALMTRNALEWNSGSYDTKFTRDLKANEEAYQAAASATYGSDAEKEAALNAVLAERTQIMTDQQTAIRTGIEGVAQLNTQIADKKTEIATAQEAFDAKNYQGAIDAINQLQQAYDQSFISGGQSGQEMFAGSDEAATALAGINSQLETLGLDKIESLSQLGSALEAVNGAQSADESAIAQLSSDLAGLQASQIELLVQASNAMDSLNWNTGRIADADLPSALKIDESTASSIETLNTDLQTASTLLEGVGTAGGTAAGGMTNAGSSADTASGQIASLRQNVATAQSALNDLAGEYKVTVNYVFNVPPTPKLPAGASKQANGGIYDGAMLSIVAEDGPEAIIPLGSKRRDRGLRLWMEAGRMLGVTEFAEGGIMSPYSDALGSLPEEVWSDSGEGEGIPSQSTGNVQGVGGGNTISVNVSANPTFQIEGNTSPDEILAMLKSKSKELAELLGSAFADELEDIVSNMV